MSKELIGIDIFSGCGGMSLGAEMAGIKIKFAIESDTHAAQTYIKNHPNTKMFIEDICNVNPLKLKKKNIFILFGGPPCQGFSVSNTKTRTVENDKNKLFEQFFRFVKDLSPKWFVFENVEGFKSFNNGETLKTLKNKLESIGYTTYHNVLNASDYGVPQNRKRFFLIGNKDGVLFEPPISFSHKVTVGEAISDLPNLNNGEKYDTLPYKKNIRLSDYAKFMRADLKIVSQNYVSRNADYVIERYKYIKQGENWQAIPPDLMKNYTNKNNCHSGIYKRLENDKPSVVIANYRKNMLIHPEQNRGLSLREAARLQSFPDSFEFCGFMDNMQQQIGNAVPPLLAKAIFEQILLYEKTKQH